MRFTEKLRMYWDDLFYPALVSRLEEDLLRVRQDFEARILEYKNTVAELRSEKSLLQSKLAIYEISMQQRNGIDPTKLAAKKPSFSSFTSPPVITRWQQFQNEYEAAVLKDDVDEIEAQKMAARKLAERDAQGAMPVA